MITKKSDTSHDHSSWPDHAPGVPIFCLETELGERLISPATLRGTLGISASTERRWRNPKTFNPPLESVMLPGVGRRYFVREIRAFVRVHQESTSLRHRRAGELGNMFQPNRLKS